MGSVFDVAAYILEQKGPMTAMKLQKLVYYAQAWSLVWDERQLFPDKIKAWANGPVVPALYQEHKGRFNVDRLPRGSSDALDSVARETLDAVLQAYGDRSSQWLSDLTHEERPWRDARRDVPDGEAGSAEITPAAMVEFYSSLTTDNSKSLE